MALPSFIWPTKPKPHPGLLARAGRVIHWAGIVLVGCWIIWAGGICITGQYEWWMFLYLSLAAHPLYALARAVRYILASE